MSDTQDQPSLLQRRRQQRQILAMMGIEQWVRPDSLTINIAHIPSATVDQPVSLERSASEAVRPSFDSEQPVPDTAPIVTDYDGTDYDGTDYATANTVSNDLPDLQSLPMQDPATQSPATAELESNAINPSIASHTQTAAKIDVMQPDVTPTVEHLIAPLVESSIEKVTAPVAEIAFTAQHNTADYSLKKVAPFDLQGGRYGNWVLIVDIQALNNDSQKLWQNITQALTLSCETASFPICEGMDTAELANASLAGYLFKIGRSEEVLVAALTDLPDGLTHPNLAHVPTLDQMLIDASLKRDLWQQLSSSN
ncbi:hypothetical protein H4W00_001684 [Psychrobacter sp. PL19]|uniref:hypothetical protein n=1 Tax=Psychrobacter sp. PL19 TaxID=2760711 RepID=UPI001AE9D2C4